MSVNNMITSEDISVIVQGNICGTQENPKEYTKKLCESIRRYYPEAEIIVSTWKGQDVEGIGYNRLVLSEPIGMTYIIRPDGNVYPHTLNHQLITTKVGIEAATRKYVLKIRSDMIVNGDKLIQLWNRYGEKEVKRNKVYSVSMKRIIVLPSYNHRRKMCYPYNVCDWLYFGLKEDVLSIFDIPLLDCNNLKVRNGEKYPRIEDNMGAEQYIWTEFLKSKGIATNLNGAMDSSMKEIELSEKTYANNLIMVSAKKLGVNSQKMPSSGYAAIPCLSQGLYTFAEWKRLCNMYAEEKYVMAYNPLEDIYYMIMLIIRRLVKSKNNRLYGKIIKIIRKIRCDNA